MFDEQLDRARTLKAYVDGPPSRRRWMRRERLLDAVARHVAPMVAVDRDGIRYLIDTSDRSELTMALWMGGEYEEPMMRKALACIAAATGREDALRGRTFVDVGANIGTATLVAARRFGAAAGLALEPHPANLRMLKMNLAANDLDEQVAVVAAAVTAAATTLELEQSPENIGDHRVRVGPPTPGDQGELTREVLTVPGVTLDAALAARGIDPAGVGLVWIDVQGHEAQVLAGMPGLAASGAPIVMEYWPYGLGRAGGLDAVHAFVSAPGRAVWELPEGDAPARKVTRDELPAMAARLGDAAQFSNLLVLPDSAAA